MIALQLMSVAAMVGWLTLSQAAIAPAEPYRPTNDAQLLERLSLNAADPVAREINALRKDLSQDPHHLESAVRLATRYVERSRAEGDPRYLGQAQAVLAPWWHESIPPPAALLLRATIRQNAHEFDSALADLDAILSVQPSNAQAWLTKATVLQAQGRYEEARRACQPLTRLAARHLALTCLSDVASLTGQSAKSLEFLRGLLSSAGLSDRERLWISTIAAEIAARTGDTETAKQIFSAALKVGIKDQYLLGAYADFLLDQGRYRDAVALLQRETKADGLLLRLALAETVLRLPEAQDHTASLAARFAANRERGTATHLREEARFTLALQDDPQRALSMAQANWNVQREPADARILIESALAASNRDAARPVLDWLHTHRVEDVRLRQLAARIQKEPR